jgi:hypothetical protein
MARLCERRVGYDRLVGEHAYLQLTELYRALRRSRQLLPALDETALERTRREKSALRLRSSQDSVATLAPVRGLAQTASNKN